MHAGCHMLAAAAPWIDTLEQKVVFCDHKAWRAMQVACVCVLPVAPLLMPWVRPSGCRCGTCSRYPGSLAFGAAGTTPRRAQQTHQLQQDTDRKHQCYSSSAAAVRAQAAALLVVGGANDVTSTCAAAGVDDQAWQPLLQAYRHRSCRKVEHRVNLFRWVCCISQCPHQHVPWCALPAAHLPA